MENFELKYKSALGSATTMYTCAKENKDKELIQSLELIFPELKESEDERIRKEIICYFDREITLSNFGGDIATFKKWIAWLEKQSDISPTKDELEALWIAAYEPTKNWSEKLQSLHEKLTRCEQIPNDKTGWSEEDEDSVDIAIRIIQNGGDDCAGILDSGKALKWLQSLKQRFNGTK